MEAIPEPSRRIAELLLVGFTVFALFGCSGNKPVTPTAPTQTTPTSAAPAAHLDVEIDGSGSTGALIGFTPVHFSAAASTADTPTYVVDYGDGTQTTDPVSVHQCRKIGLLTSQVTITDKFGRTSSATAQYACLSLVHQEGVLYSLLYGWDNSYENAKDQKYEERKIAFDSQDGSKVSGFYTHPAGNQSHFTGTLSGDHSISFSLDDRTMSFSGDVVLKDVFSERGGYTYNRHLILRLRGGSADGAILDFTFIDPASFVQ
ncbi:MAG: hypothetical protein ACM3SQ_20260 [Betaproteobacteria bacterium]